MQPEMLTVIGEEKNSRKEDLKWKMKKSSSSCMTVTSWV